ncbi:MAG: DUF1893 domain-containing protein [Peptostreptococcaceae bacterium]|nr:DUF1893 domain-containing protein [Peptostreptococcaceae bacterium]
MHKDLKMAVDMLYSEGRALVLVRNGEVLKRDDRRGIGPMYDIATGERSLSDGSSLADKVIGKAAAMLAVDAGIARLYALVISEEAEKVLSDAKMEYHFKTMVPFIQNREKTGKCPMERLAGGIEFGDTEVLKERLREFLKTVESWKVERKNSGK